MARLIKTPGTVISAAVCLFIYGGLMLLCVGCAGANPDAFDPNNPDNERLAKEVPGHAVIEIGTAVLNLPVGLLMILAGVGLLRLMPSARYLAYGITLFEIVLALLHSIHSAVWVIPAQNRIVAEQIPNLPPGPFAELLLASMWGMLLFGLALVLVFLVPVIFLLSTRSARAAFASEYFDPPPHLRRRPYDDFDDDDDDFGRPPSARDTGFRERF
jgi:sulfite exporter TauE/SafE